MEKVTDPALLAELNGTPVNDPAILEELNNPRISGAASLLPWNREFKSGPELMQTAKDTWEGIKSGSTFNFGDELQAGIAAYTSAPFIEGLSLGEAYDQALPQLRQENVDAQANNPIAYTAGNIGGALATGGGLINAAKSTAPNVASRVARAAALNPIKTGASVGATQGGLSGFGRGEGDLSNRAGTAALDAGIGGITGGLVGGVASGLTGRMARGNKPVTADDIRSQASAAYTEAAQKGGVLKDTFTNNFLNEIQKINPQTTAGKALAGDSPVSQIIKRFDSIKDQPLALDEIQEIDEYLGEAAESFIENGRYTKQGKKIIDIQSKLRDMIDSAGPSDISGTKEGFEALDKARGLYSKSMKLGDIERIITRAELTDNPATSIKTGFRTMLTNPSKMRGFNDAEKEAIRKAATTGVISDILRTAGSRLTGIIAGASGNIPGAVIANAGGTLSRNAATRLQLGRANSVADLIASGQTASRVTNPALVGQAALISNQLAPKITIRPSDRRN